MSDSPPRVASRVIAFVKLGRPHFLGGGFILYALGAAIARARGAELDVGRYALGQGIVTAFQLMTHYANEYFDVLADRANATPTAWSGGSRVLVRGDIPVGAALIGALVLAAIGTGLGIASPAPWLFLPMGFLAWAYSAPPLRLCARGLGELDTGVVVTGLVPAAGFVMQGAPGGWGALVATCIPLVLLQVAMLIAIEFPDAEGDAATGKRTLVVRMGVPRAVALYRVVLVAAYAWLPFAWAIGVPVRAVLAGAVTLPIAAWRFRDMPHDAEDPGRYERLALWGVGILVIESAALLAGWL